MRAFRRLAFTAPMLLMVGCVSFQPRDLNPAAHRLYVAHATRIIVIDTKTAAVVGEVAGLTGAHGFAVASELGRGFATSGRDNTVLIVDLKTLATVGKVTTGENPDAILLDPAHKAVWAFCGRSKEATVIDAATGTVRATVKLPGKPEFAVLDAVKGLIYNNLEDVSAVAVLDTAAMKLVTTWPIAPGTEPSGLAFDAEHHRLFIGCDNKLMVMMDSSSGKVLGSVPIGAGVDANAFDPGTGLAFASSSDGTLTAARVNKAGVLGVVKKLVTPPHSRTMTVDPTTHAIYVAAAQFEAPTPGYGGAPARPQVLPGTFKVLVFTANP